MVEDGQYRYIPVSYTHLDVYKRQANFLLFDNTMYPTPFQNVVLSIINWTAGVIFAYFTNRKFVFKSNAPIDVYKRQVTYRSRRGTDAGTICTAE